MSGTSVRIGISWHTAKNLSILDTPGFGEIFCYNASAKSCQQQILAIFTRRYKKGGTYLLHSSLFNLTDHIDHRTITIFYNAGNLITCLDRLRNAGQGLCELLEVFDADKL